MSDLRGSKNLGMVKAIHIDITPPLNTRMIWFDDNLGVKIHKAYDFQQAEWLPIGGGNPSLVNGIYTYLAYATSFEGANFSLIKTNDSTHTATITSPTPIAQLTSAMFATRWVKYDTSAETSGGNYTYIRYADSCEGENMSADLLYSVPCDPCVRVDGISVVAKSNTVNASINGNIISVNFLNAINGNFIEIELTRAGVLLPNFLNYTVTTSKNSLFGGMVNLDFDPNTSIERTIDQTTPNTETYLQVINGSRIKVYIPYISQIGNFVGTLDIQVGSESCLSAPTECFKCRNYVGFHTSNEPLAEEDIIADLFENKWFPIGSGCSEDNSGDLDVINKQITYLQKMIYDSIASQNSQIITLTTNLATLKQQFDAYVTSNNNALTTGLTNKQTQINTINTNVSDLTTSTNNALDNLGNQIDDTLTESKEYTDVKISEVSENVTEITNDHQQQLNDHETRIQELENPPTP